MMLAVASTAGAAVAQRWSDQASREKERQLLRVGDAYARALADYRASSPGSDKRYPTSLDQLLLDTRFAGIRRHLRALYPDPLTGLADWVLVRDSRGDIVGVRSRSLLAPWIHTPQRLQHTDLPPASRYADWVFTPRQTHP
ncbi:MAG: type II secretion system protein [Burkholderiales bacterium]|nr:type II secretion system protein [Burkholderiales bacterium]